MNVRKWAAFAAELFIIGALIILLDVDSTWKALALGAGLGFTSILYDIQNKTEKETA